MARGKKIDLTDYLTRLEPFLKEGCSLHEACLHADIPYTTMVDYDKKDSEVRRKIEMWQNEPVLKALRSVNKHMDDDGNLALKYLERKKKDEFSTKHVAQVDGDINIVYADKDDENV